MPSSCARRNQTKAKDLILSRLMYEEHVFSQRLFIRNFREAEEKARSGLLKKLEKKRNPQSITRIFNFIQAKSLRQIA